MSTVSSLESNKPDKITEVAANNSCVASDLESDPGSCMVVPDVVGRCVDCSCPYDRFSGLVVCTVCRLPVLVCDVCAEEKCYPGEYHCFRHRYRTVIDAGCLRVIDIVYLSNMVPLLICRSLLQLFCVWYTRTYTQARYIPYLIPYIAPDLPLLYHSCTCLSMATSQFKIH